MGLNLPGEATGVRCQHPGEARIGYFGGCNKQEAHSGRQQGPVEGRQWRSGERVWLCVLQGPLAGGEASTDDDRPEAGQYIYIYI